MAADARFAYERRAVELTIAAMRKDGQSPSNNGDMCWWEGKGRKDSDAPSLDYSFLAQLKEERDRHRTGIVTWEDQEVTLKTIVEAEAPPVEN